MTSALCAPMSDAMAVDVLVLTGNLGAGKTTFVQGLARGLGIVEPVTSPTFVISRVLPAPSGPDLVHMDAYRLGGSAELFDLDVEVESVITVIEWGHDAGPMIADDVLELVIDIDEDDPDLRRRRTRRSRRHSRRQRAASARCASARSPPEA
jgi:tRNA threonylcarbamoyladenosine biosynthesis protein TsaE